MTRPRILAYSYDVNPDFGSEPGAGWAAIQILAGFADVTVLTRSLEPDGDGTFEPWTSRIVGPGTVEFVSVRLPGDPRSEDHGEVSPAVTRQPYVGYMLWQLQALRVARRIHRRRPFDLTWHLTWANGWLGSTLSMVDAPFVLGPIGGGVSPPWRLVLGLHARGIAFELVRAAVRTSARYFNPLARVSWRRARLILVQNRETRDFLPASARPKTVIFHNATVADPPSRTRVRRPDEAPTALFVGRLVPLKGWHLAMRTIAGLAGWRLVMLGDGPDEAACRALGERLGVTDRIELRGWQGRDAVLKAMAEEADILLFPSFHDEAGLAVAEAAAIGLPIVCLDKGGPPAIAGSGVHPGDEAETVERLRAAAVSAAASHPAPALLEPASRRTELVELLRGAGLIAAGADGDAAS